MEIVIKSRNKPIKQKIEKDHYWFDVVDKKMIHLKGGKLKFKYDQKQERYIPYVEDLEDYVHKNDFDEIKKWLETGKKKYNIEVNLIQPGFSVSIDVDAHDFTEIVTDLFLNKIIFDFDEDELEKELKK